MGGHTTGRPVLQFPVYLPLADFAASNTPLFEMIGVRVAAVEGPRSQHVTVGTPWVGGVSFLHNLSTSYYILDYLPEPNMECIL